MAEVNKNRMNVKEAEDQINSKEELIRESHERWKNDQGY